MASNTEFVILGMLSVEPMSGYKIKQEVKQSISGFWSESDGQLYPALKRLQAAGLIQVSLPSTATKRAKTVYKILKKGRNVLIEWLNQAPLKNVIRDEFLLKIFFAANMEIEDLQVLIEDQRSKVRQQNGLLKQIRREIENHVDESPHGRYWLATLQYGQYILEAKLQWFEEMLQNFNHKTKEN